MKLIAIDACHVMGGRVAARGPSEERVRRTVFRILEDTPLCSIATVTSDQRAHINTAYFCYSGELELFFLSHPGSLHCRNLENNSSMAVAIFSSSQQWTNPGRGLQLFGTCRQAKGPAAKKAERLYGKRFMAYPQWRAGLKQGDRALDYRLYRFETSALKILDEEEFGDAVFVRAAVRR